MERISKEQGKHYPSLSSILLALEKSRDRLYNINTTSGYLLHYAQIKKEIEQESWAKICAKYHPDVNIDDPAAHELFHLYKFVYGTMNRSN